MIVFSASGVKLFREKSVFKVKKTNHAVFECNHVKKVGKRHQKI